ncbi:MAG TPA: RNA polymerase sigma factor [Solirubrobacterales bacterium]|nr:RNA polymerase sigma factor [Solirubrobacterales bacterium]
MSPPPAEQFAARIFIGPALRAQPDRRLVDLVRNGYDAAFEEIVRRYRRPLDRFAAAIVGGRSEDVTQDAFSKALLALRGTEAEIELRPWLYRIVRNTALNDLRDRAPEAAELSETLPGGRSAAAEAEAREELTDLMERLRALPEPQRAALVMRELEGLSHEEIAAALGVSGGAARQAIYRARAALREGLGFMVPMPVVQALAEHGDAAAAGGAIAAGTGASTAGGAALGGLGGGAVKAGVATLLVAGAVGAGVAVDHRQGERSGPEPAQAAPLVERPESSAGSAAGGGSSSPGGSAGDSSGHGRGDDDHPGEGGDDHDGDLSGGDRSDSGHGSDRSGHSGHSGSGDRVDNSGPGSVSSGRHGGDDDDHSGHGSGGSDDSSSGSGSSGSGSGDDSSGSGSGSSGSGSSGSGDDGDSSGPGSGEPAPESSPDPAVEEEPDDDSSGSGSGSSGSGRVELSGNVA